MSMVLLLGILGALGAIWVEYHPESFISVAVIFLSGTGIIIWIDKRKRKITLEENKEKGR